MPEQTAPAEAQQPEPRHVLVRIEHADVTVIQPIGRREAERRRLKVLPESAYLLSGRLKPVQRIPVEPAEQATDTGDQDEPDSGSDAAAPAAAAAEKPAAAPKGKAPKTSAATGVAKTTGTTTAPDATTLEEK